MQRLVASDPAREKAVVEKKITPGFKKGQSGNPNGRPKGSRNRATLLAIAAIEGELDAIVRVVIDAAKAGDMVAARLVVDKLIPPSREVPIAIELPSIREISDCTTVQAMVFDAVASGQLLPDEGKTLSALAENHRRSLETADLSERLSAIEAQMKGKK